ncbi:MAG TPA: DUF4345 family protein [Sphingomonadaceae bacterium]
MRLILTALLFVGGLLFVFYGLSFLIVPASIGAGFGLQPATAMGWATIRADMTAFFIVCGVCMMVGAWKRSGDVLLVPALLCGIAVIGRAVSAFADGAYDGFWLTMLIEAAVVAVSLAGHRLLPHHQVEEITG